MRALYLILVGATAALLLSTPAGAVEATKATAAKTMLVAQQADTCRGWGVRCETDVTPKFCLADDKCATALPGSALIRFDEMMDTTLSF